MGKGARLKALRRAARDEREAVLERRRHESVNAQVLCPVANKYVDTGIAMDVFSFNGNNQILNAQVGCPECGGTHTLTDEDLVLAT